MKDDPLAKMIVAAQKGEPEAFTWLLQEYGPRLLAYFRRFSGSPTDAEDLLQDLFVRLVTKIGNYHHEGRFEHWLFRVGANLARDQARQRRRHGKTVSLDAPRSDTDSWAGTLASQEKTPEQKLLHAEQLDQLQEALKQLSDVDRRIILLRHYGHLSFKELAQHFQMPIGTVLAKVHRSLKRLNRIMDNEKL